MEKNNNNNTKHVKYLCQSWVFFSFSIFVLFSTNSNNTWWCYLKFSLERIFLHYNTVCIFVRSFFVVAFLFYCIKFVLSGAWGPLSCWCKLAWKLFDSRVHIQKWKLSFFLAFNQSLKNKHYNVKNLEGSNPTKCCILPMSHFRRCTWTRFPRLLNYFDRIITTKDK